jgi:hypothetical protein
MVREFRGMAFERYADDAVVHLHLGAGRKGVVGD